LIAALGALRWWRDDKAGAQNVYRDISVGPDSAALTVIPIPGLEMPRARSRDQRRQAVATEGVGEDSLVPGVAIQRRDSIALAAHEADRRRVGELAGDLGAADQSKPTISTDHRPLVGANRKCRNTMRRVIGLPFGE